MLYGHSCFLSCEYLLFITPAFCPDNVNTCHQSLTVLATPCFALVHLGFYHQGVSIYCKPQWFCNFLPRHRRVQGYFVSVVWMSNESKDQVSGVICALPQQCVHNTYAQNEGERNLGKRLRTERILINFFNSFLYFKALQKKLGTFLELHNL